MIGWYSAKPFVQPTPAPESDFQADIDPSGQSTPVLVGQHQTASRTSIASSAIQNQLGPSRPVSDFRFDGKTTDRADLMLRRARHMIDDGSAFETNVSVRAAFFGQQVAGSGHYIQAGQGAGKARTILAFHIPKSQSTHSSDVTSTATPPQQKVTNLCDGRFVYRLHEDLIESRQTLEFYDLQKIKNSESDRRNKTLSHRPGIPLAPGELMASGMAGLLQHLADEFRFAVVAEESDTRRTRTLRGTWQPRRIQRLMQGYLGGDGQQPELAWSQLPPNLPHAVELSLVRTSEWELFPSRLTFYQFKAIEQRTVARPVVVIEFQNPKAIGTISDDQFVLRSEHLEATDLTYQYLSKLRPEDDNAIR